MYQSNPQPVTAGTPTQLQLPTDPSNIGTLLLVNNSGYLLRIDGLTDPDFISPWTTDVFPVGRRGNITVTPVVVDTAPSPTASAYVIASWGLLDEQIPGTFPQPLTANAVAAAVTDASAAAIAAANLAAGSRLVDVSNAVLGYGLPNVSGNWLNNQSVQLVSALDVSVYQSYTLELDGPAPFALSITAAWSDTSGVLLTVKTWEIPASGNTSIVDSHYGPRMTLYVTNLSGSTQLGTVVSNAQGVQLRNSFRPMSAEKVNPVAFPVGRNANLWDAWGDDAQLFSATGNVAASGQTGNVFLPLKVGPATIEFTLSNAGYLGYGYGINTPIFQRVVVAAGAYAVQPIILPRRPMVLFIANTGASVATFKARVIAQ